MHVPDGLLYTEEHEWILEMEGSEVRIGITDYAQDQLGDVVYVQLPSVGATVSSGESVAEVSRLPLDESMRPLSNGAAPYATALSAVSVVRWSLPPHASAMHPITTARCAGDGTTRCRLRGRGRGTCCITRRRRCGRRWCRTSSLPRAPCCRPGSAGW